jgi:hypothetical protein
MAMPIPTIVITTMPNMISFLFRPLLSAKPFYKIKCIPYLSWYRYLFRKVFRKINEPNIKNIEAMKDRRVNIRETHMFKLGVEEIVTLSAQKMKRI